MLNKYLILTQKKGKSIKAESVKNIFEGITGEHYRDPAVKPKLAPFIQKPNYELPTGTYKEWCEENIARNQAEYLKGLPGQGVEMKISFSNDLEMLHCGNLK